MSAIIPVQPRVSPQASRLGTYYNTTSRQSVYFMRSNTKKRGLRGEVRGSHRDVPFLFVSSSDMRLGDEILERIYAVFPGFRFRWYMD